MNDNECKGCKHEKNKTMLVVMEVCNYCKRASDDEFHRMHHPDFFEPFESDLISKKTLIGKFWEYTNCGKQRYLIPEDIWEMVELMPSVDRWIPCSERMPKEPEDGYGSHDGYIVQCSHIYEPFSAYWDGKVFSDDDGNILEGIIAWMPLPEPYKEGMNRE